MRRTQENDLFDAAEGVLDFRVFEVVMIPPSGNQPAHTVCKKNDFAALEGLGPFTCHAFLKIPCCRTDVLAPFG